jgi:hypothetical protein
MKLARRWIEIQRGNETGRVLGTLVTGDEQGARQGGGGHARDISGWQLAFAQRGQNVCNMCLVLQHKRQKYRDASSAGAIFLTIYALKFRFLGTKFILLHLLVADALRIPG